MLSPVVSDSLFDDNDDDKFNFTSGTSSVFLFGKCLSSAGRGSGCELICVCFVVDEMFCCLSSNGSEHHPNSQSESEPDLLREALGLPRFDVLTSELINAS